jgi:hypothetical protein
MIYSADSGYSFIIRGEYDLAGIADGGKKSSERVSGKLSGKIQPVNRIIKSKFGGSPRKNKKNGIAFSPDFPHY